MIPILDLKDQYRTIKAEVDAAVLEVLASGQFIMGPHVEAFEKELASFLHVRHAISLNSGTDALHLALRGLGIGPGDEVITSPFTFAATSEAISILGAKPVFVDIDLSTFNIDAESIEAAITPRTRAILPIHLYGAPADLDAIGRIAASKGIWVVEDCAQAIGATIGSRKVGTIGIAGCFSFFPSKNLGACGDGGLVATNDDALADRIRALRAHGGSKKYYHTELGVNSRLDEIQAAILRVKLKHLDAWTRSRMTIAARYDEALAFEHQIPTQRTIPGATHVYHQYTIRVERRDQARDMLLAYGIQTMIYYPLPLHLQETNRYLNYSVGDFPKTEEAARTVLSLPIYPELRDVDQEFVIDSVLKVAQTAVAR